MSVVVHRSTGKMIFKGLVVTLFSLSWLKTAAGGTSYSNVYVQSGPGLTSLYGPAPLTGAQLAPLSASPLMSNVLPPCVSPCVIPSQRIAAVAPVATSSANFVSYKSPISVPIVVATPTNDDAASYEYSYVVYDEDTGDQKALKELSDNGVVRGQYSLVQPDGYVREVQYTADDLRGFNAVVRNFLPKFAINTGTEGKSIPPCPEGKNEPLKESSGGESHDLELEVRPKESQSHEEPGQPKNEGTHQEVPKPEVPGEFAAPKEPAKPEGSAETQEAKAEPVQEIPKEPKNNNEVHGEESFQGKPGETNVLVSYNDVIKCLQAAIKGVAPMASPLTYIVLNKPC